MVIVCFLLVWVFSLVEDKGDGTDAETGLPEDVLIHDEIYKSRLASIKRVSWYFYLSDYSLSSLCL